MDQISDSDSDSDSSTPYRCKKNEELTKMHRETWLCPELWAVCLCSEQFDPDSPELPAPLGVLKNPIQQMPAVLDALAQCCIYEPRHQNVAVSVIATTAGTMLFVSQEGGSLALAVGHLHNVLAYIRRIRESEALPSNSEHIKELMRDFELFLIKFSFKKLRRRILKHLDAFVNLAPLLPSPERYEGVDGMDADIARLLSLMDVFRDIRSKLLLPGPVSDADLIWIMGCLKASYQDFKPEYTFEDPEDYGLSIFYDLSVSLCMSFRSRVRNLILIVPAVKTAVRNSLLSIGRSFRKMWSFRENFLTLVRLATSDHLSGLISSHCIIEAVLPMQRPVTIDLRFDTFL